MSNQEKVEQIFQLIVDKTYPKEQFGFYSESNLYQDIARIING